jgi:Fe-S-cluster containining protein
VIEHRGTLLSEDLFEKRFVCDLNACKGACCEQGDSGAPLTAEEAAEIKKHYAALMPYMTTRGKKAVERQGTSVVDMDGELVTPLVEEYQECAFARKDGKGTWKCGIENAWRDGKVPMRKPISCHLYPIRVEKLAYHDALNYSQWGICAPACACGAKLDVPVFRFLKESLTRAYGKEWYDELEVIYQAWVSRSVARSGVSPGKG